MKLLSFHYHLKLRMDAFVNSHRFILRCVPGSDERQRILKLDRYVFPYDYLRDAEDQWGNAYLYGGYRGQHNVFEANICGQAVTGLSSGTASADPAREGIFRYATPLTQSSGGLKQFSDGLSVRSGAPEEIEAVMHAVHEALSYAPGATGTRTTAAEAFDQGCGVCQDYSHIMLAALRSRGVIARYAAGMMLGEGASHAWVEVLHGGIWTGYDPTNDLVVSDGHIKLSHGRDAWDCSINRGIFRGSADQTTEISVIVAEEH